MPKTTDLNMFRLTDVSNVENLDLEVASTSWNTWQFQWVIVSILFEFLN
jgi:hypothetical protein